MEIKNSIIINPLIPNVLLCYNEQTDFTSLDM